MKIVIPAHHVPPRYSAGVEVYTLRLARWLQSQGHEVELVAIEAIDQGDPDAVQADRELYQGLPVWRLTLNLQGASATERVNYDNPALRGWFERYLAQARPDLMHVQSGYLLGVAPLEAARAAGIPSVLTLHDYWYLCPRITLKRGDGSLCAEIPSAPGGCAWCIRQESRRYRVADQASAGLAGAMLRLLPFDAERQRVARRRASVLPALELPAAIISPSRFLASRFGPFVDAEKLHIVPYGLELEPFLEQRARRPRPNDGTLRVGYIGQIAPHKGIHLLLEAFAQLQAGARPLELHLHGDLERFPDYVAQLVKLAGADPRVFFHGPFEHRQAPAILAGLDVTVAPSLWYENSPLAIQEAHAAGAPVITADLGGMAELVRDGHDGLLFKPGDAADLARQLQRLLDEPELLGRLRQQVEPPCSNDEAMGQVQAIYQRILKPKPTSIRKLSSTTVVHSH